MIPDQGSHMLQQSFTDCIIDPEIPCATTKALCSQMETNFFSLKKKKGKGEVDSFKIFSFTEHISQSSTSQQLFHR